jgi:PIN domain nuclease of toxin-antitoxin system
LKARYEDAGDLKKNLIASHCAALTVSAISFYELLHVTCL